MDYQEFSSSSSRHLPSYLDGAVRVRRQAAEERFRSRQERTDWRQRCARDTIPSQMDDCHRLAFFTIPSASSTLLTSNESGAAPFLLFASSCSPSSPALLDLPRPCMSAMMR